MKFGELPLSQAIGARLAHSHRLNGGRRLTKGTALTSGDIEELHAIGRTTVFVACMEPEDLHEDEAADQLGAAVIGPHISASPARTGRVNFFAQQDGLFMPNAATVKRFNAIDPALTLATLDIASRVSAGDMVATLKIIPFAVPDAIVSQCLETLNSALAVHPWVGCRALLIQTCLDHTADKILDKTAQTLSQRLEHIGASLIEDIRCEHNADALAAHLTRVHLGTETRLIVVSGASAIIDQHDIIPQALNLAGGHVKHFGMPVDPGNLLMIGELPQTQNQKGGASKPCPVIGMPGCARSLARNGFDLVLERLCAGLDVTPQTLQAMGVGGLLKDTPARPLPRAEVLRRSGGAPPTVWAILLAAGLSRRMGTENKLLMPFNGCPMVARTAQAISDSRVEATLAVLGHEAEQVRGAISHIEALHSIVAPDYAQGLAHSLHAGLAALPDRVDGALICLGDMPLVTSETINQMISKFDPAAGASIVAPVYDGVRANPVLWGRKFFEDISELNGDKGARELLLRYNEMVVELPISDQGVITDYDQPSDFERL